eukprot:1151866-Pelagomonas_calceolata.AAC.2
MACSKCILEDLVVAHPISSCGPPLCDPSALHALCSCLVPSSQAHAWSPAVHGRALTCQQALALYPGIMTLQYLPVSIDRLYLPLPPVPATDCVPCCRWPDKYVAGRLVPRPQDVCVPPGAVCAVACVKSMEC